jgi:phage-related protein
LETNLDYSNTDFWHSNTDNCSGKSYSGSGNADSSTNQCTDVRSDKCADSCSYIRSDGRSDKRTGREDTGS